MHIVNIIVVIIYYINILISTIHFNEQAQKTLTSLQKLKLLRGFQLDSEIKKSVTFIIKRCYVIVKILISKLCTGIAVRFQISIFWIRVNARKIKVNIGGYIIIDMDFI